MNISEKECLVLGCGNPLLGDDGFGPAVVERLVSAYRLPEHAGCIDAGTAVRDILFDILLAAKKPSSIIIIDAADVEGKKPGEIFEIDVDQVNPAKIHDFSLHQFPTTNMLKELKTETEVDVRILVTQTSAIPDTVAPGLSEAVERAIDPMCRRIIEITDGERR